MAANTKKSPPASEPKYLKIGRRKYVKKGWSVAILAADYVARVYFSKIYHWTEKRDHAYYAITDIDPTIPKH
jgi:hypothetical protein